jgi:hypothetical protein
MLLSVLHFLPDVGQVDAFAEPWRRLYSHSTLVSTLVMFGHIGGLVAGGGLALASDRQTLRLDGGDVSARSRHLDELARQRLLVNVAFGVAIVTGALLFFADVEAFAASRIFWAKMALIALLVVNLGVISRVESALRASAARDVVEADASAVHARLWRRRRLGALVSVVLWFVLVLAGTALASH